MDWATLLNGQRLCTTTTTQNQDERPFYLQDLDRIIFSEPFRRLANKTQVHPLYENDHVHQRLIHSIEASSIGRSLGTNIEMFLKNKGVIDERLNHNISGVVQAACLAHDIGNPPFGHSGERAIGGWFSEKFDEKKGIFEGLQDRNKIEFKKFEGNAQGFRILTKTEMYKNQGGMRLSYAVLATFSKYPTTSLFSEKQDAQYCGLKKFGIFSSEESIFKKIAEETNLIEEKREGGSWWKRHPLAFLVEAADDICYNIMDVEDAFISGDISFSDAEKLITPLIKKDIKYEDYFTEKDKMSKLRALAINSVIGSASLSFFENYERIMDGSFSSSLINESDVRKEFEEIRTASKDIIFTANRKIELEILGRNSIYKILDGLLPLIEWKFNKNDENNYFKQIEKLTGIDTRNIKDEYSALQALTDYVSGMTDRYAVKIANLLHNR